MLGMGRDILEGGMARKMGAYLQNSNEIWHVVWSRMAVEIRALRDVLIKESVIDKNKEIKTAVFPQ